MNLSPTSISIQEGKSTLLTANVSVQNGSISRVNFSSNNLNIVSPNPTSVSSSPYVTAVYGVKVGSASITAQAVLSPSGSCSKSVPVSVEARAWFQTQGGDIHTQGSLSDRIPSTATNPNLSLDLNNYPGVVSHTEGLNLGEGYPSKNTAGNWVAQSEYQGKPYGSFDFFKKKFALQIGTDNFNGSLPPQDGVYYSQNGETLSGSWSLGSHRWLVIMVDGDVTVPTNIIVPEGSFLAIASSGKITFKGDVTKAQGMFVAQTIETEASTNSFEGQGIFVAQNFNLNRDFNDSRNQTTPAETFVARPDFLMSSYRNKDENLWWFFQKWQELAP